jgi:hypothetical protein
MYMIRVANFRPKGCATGCLFGTAESFSWPAVGRGHRQFAPFLARGVKPLADGAAAPLSTGCQSFVRLVSRKTR